MAATIRRLDETVVNRIAAGEVIQRPANAIKEMIENCLDAQSTNIQVTVKDGGLKMIQIQDNGSGVQKNDMDIVCERFTTSKLSKFEDLNSINTYGFRGEALASISHIAHVTIMSRTADSKCAYRGQYSDGKLKEPAKPCAGNFGTQITAEDLFYNISTRRKSLKNSSDEYSRIVDVVSRYAVHNAAVGFSLKKHGAPAADVKTPPSSSKVDNIRLIYGAAIAREVLEIKDDDPRLGMKVTGYITNANYSMKKGVFLLFINGRRGHSVKKALIAPQNIDVNVHPTKYEVHFLHQEQVIERIQKCVEQRLLGCSSSRTFYTQTLIALPKSGQVETVATTDGKEDKNYAYNMVRTDHTERKIDQYFQSQADTDTQTHANELPDALRRELPTNNEEALCGEPGGDKENRSQDCIGGKKKSPEGEKRRFPSESAPGGRQKVTLSSVLDLQRESERSAHERLREIIKEHSFVGCVNKSFSLIQHQTKLYLVNNKHLTQELFYQIMLYDFGNFGVLKLSEKTCVKELAMLALDLPECGWTPEDGAKEDIAKYASQFLQTKAGMLSDYFSMEIDKEGKLCSLPLLLNGYVPELERVPLFLARLVTEVNWDEEKICLDDICKETSLFYALQKEILPAPVSQLSFEDDQWKKVTENVLFPALRTTLLPSVQRAEDATFLEIANLHNLYRVFESGSHDGYNR